MESVFLGLVTSTPYLPQNCICKIECISLKGIFQYELLTKFTCLCWLGPRAETTGTSVCSFYRSMLTHISLQSSTWSTLFRLRPTRCRKPTIWFWMWMAGPFSCTFFLEVECSANMRLMRLCISVISMVSLCLSVQSALCLPVQSVWLGEYYSYITAVYFICLRYLHDIAV
jgi:hypothetical protein